MIGRNIMIAGDPGYTTGVCVARITGPNSYELVECIALHWSNRFYLGKLIDKHQDQLLAVVMEEFRLFNNQASIKAQINSEFPSVRIIGNVEGYLADRNLLHLLHFQTPSDRKNVKIPVEHQKQVGQIDHTQDAYRHLRYWFLLNRKKVPDLC